VGARNKWAGMLFQGGDELSGSRDAIHVCPSGVELKANGASARIQALPAAVLIHEVIRSLDRQELQMHNMGMLDNGPAGH